MYQYEILALIKTLSKRRCKKVVQLTKLMQYPATNSKEIVKATTAIKDFDIEIDHLMKKI